MENREFGQLDQGMFEDAVIDTQAVTVFLRQVFTYMALALAVSGVLAWVFGTNEALFSMLRNPLSGGPTMLGYVVMFAPLGMIFLIGGMVNKMSSSTLIMTFIAFSAIMGISFSYIFVIYSLGSIINVFFLTGGVFALMAVAGYTTSTDLTKLGSILIIGLIGIVIASVVNVFLGNGMLDHIISILGIVIFTGLIAYEMQQLKRLGASVINGTESATKMAIMGALNLYLSFINLFLILLRFFGSRD